MITKEDLLEFGKIGHELAIQGIFIDDLILSFDLVNSIDHIVVYTANATYFRKEVIIAQSDDWNKFIFELNELNSNIIMDKLTVDDAYKRYEN